MLMLSHIGHIKASHTNAQVTTFKPDVHQLQASVC